MGVSCNGWGNVRLSDRNRRATRATTGDEALHDLAVPSPIWKPEHVVQPLFCEAAERNQILVEIRVHLLASL